MKKIGIVSMYHNSRNYGGLLQAFALCHYLNRFEDFSAVQIDLPQRDQDDTKKRSLIQRVTYYVKRLPSWLKERFFNYVFKVLRNNNYTSVKDINCKMDAFREESIPHVNVVNSSSKMEEYNDFFDVFICGSDQIWNPYAFRTEYFLEFVNAEKVKIAYSVSVARDDLNQDEEKRIAEHAVQLDAISVREESTCRMLGKNNIPNVQITLDPTFLLSKEEWCEYTNKPPIDVPYLFYYVLENDYRKFKWAKNMAKGKGYELVAIPYVTGCASGIDILQSYHPAYANTPFEFISLIQHAELVITDSFHATVFSIIFNKQFLNLECKKTKTLYPRVEKLLNVFCCEDHYIKSISQLKKWSLSDIDYSLHMDKFIRMIEESKEFLAKHIRR